MSAKPPKRYSLSQSSSSCDGFLPTSSMRNFDTSLSQGNISKILRDDQLMQIFSGNLDEPLVLPSNEHLPYSAARVLSPITTNRQNSGGGAPNPPHNNKHMSREYSASNNQHSNTPRTVMMAGTATTTTMSSNPRSENNSENVLPQGFIGNHVQVEMSHHLDTAVSSLRAAKQRPGASHDHPMMTSSSSTVYSAATKFQMNVRLPGSPSASSSLRSIQAMRNDRTQYFDVPHEEQDFVTDEERRQHATDLPTTIQEVMRNVVVYVEVRTETENRSEGIKTVIAELGATVNDKLLKNTTHVIFKDGLLSSYQKARNWNIPVVSILWIEACRKHVCLMDPKAFVISNVERYDHPELYGKLPKFKSMQPANEKSRRPKNLTPKTVVPEAPSVVHPKIRYPNKPKDNLPNIFANFTKNLMQHTDTVDECFNKNSKILEIIRNSPIVTEHTSAGQSGEPKVPAPKKTLPTKSTARRTLYDFFDNSPQSSTSDVSSVSLSDTTVTVKDSQEEKKNQTFGGNDSADVTIKETQEEPMSSTRRVKINDKQMVSRRNSQDVPNQSIVAPNVQTELNETPIRMTRRRSIQLNSSLTMDMSIVTPTPSKTPRNRRCTVFPSLIEENADETSSPMNLTEIPPNNTHIESSFSKPTPAKTNKVANEKTPSKTHSRRTIHSHVHPAVTPRTPADRQNGLLNTVLQRNTIYTPQSMQETFIQAATQPEIASSSTIAGLNEPEVVKAKSASRRRTLFTPNKVVEYDQSSNRVMERDQLLNDGGVGVSSTPKTCVAATSYASTSPPSTPTVRATFVTPFSTRTSHIPKTSRIDMHISPATPPFGVASSAEPLVSPEPTSILDAYNRTFSTPTFSSTRLPSANKRRTFFEMSMDIIDQRVQNINRLASARKNRSMSESDLGADQNVDAPSMIAIDPACAASSPQLNKMGGSRKHINEITESYTATEIVEKPVTKKRKLFAPASMSFGTPEISTPAASSRTLVKPAATKSKDAATTKRLRDDELTKPTANKRPKIVKATAVKPTLSKAASADNNHRRTTMFASSTRKVAAPSHHEPTSMAALPKRFLVTTNMHREQLSFVQETLSTLGEFELKCNVSAQTTHLVSLEPLRTINFLRAIIRGLWILRYDWVTESAKAGRWLPEDAFEVRDFSAAVAICRSARQAFGSSYRIEIFADTQPLFISTCKCPNLRELVQQCGGSVTTSRAQAKYVISDTYETTVPGSTAPCVSAAWILDSISIAKLKRVDKYLLTPDRTD